MVFEIKKIAFVFILCSSLTPLWSVEGHWPTITNEMRPGTRWWWLGSAVDKVNLTYNLEQFAQAGMGTVEITPIYGLQNNEANDIPFLSAKWMEMLKHTSHETTRLGMQTDMNTGTGWPFGGPEVSIEDAASKLFISRYKVEGTKVFSAVLLPEDAKQQGVATLSRVMAFDAKNKSIDLTSKVASDGKITWKAPKGEWIIIAAFCGKTFQKVKRAAPGGEGYVMDHFSKKAVGSYLNRFEKAFESSNTPYPHNFFNDSYEVYGADWTPDFFDQFFKRRGYKLEQHLPAFLSPERTDATARLVSDYRETIAELLLENFTQQWTSWANAHGSKTRNQAHGSPGNLIDLYATVDVPECEGFGLSDFGIKGLRTDSLVRKNDSDLSMLKYASSAANISGKQLVSSESFTWLTEHFRTSLSQIKPDLDLLFAAGVNHCYFHGSPYSPKEAAWPGWQFYASVNMTPNNTIWKDAPALFSYITRCQSFLQMGKPDNDFLIYLPIYDIWHEQKGRLLSFDIHSMYKRMPKFISIVQSIYSNGFNVDYISDKFILSATYENGKIVTEGGIAYETLVLPAVQKMPLNVLKYIVHLVEQGAKVVFMENFPTDVPGFANLKSRRKAFDSLIKKLDKNVNFEICAVRPYKKGQIITGSDYKTTLLKVGKKPEELKTKFGLHALRRSNPQGYHYFISALHQNDMNDWVTLSVNAVSAEIYDPLTGQVGKAKLRQHNGNTQVYLQMPSGVSYILKTYTSNDVATANWKYLQKANFEMDLNKNWHLHFHESVPSIDSTFAIAQLVSWTDLPTPNAKINRGTGIYKTSFNIDAISNDEWMLYLGDVRESAKVFVNGENVGALWSVPFNCNISKYIKKGINTLEIHVTNLPANAISEMDRNEVEWRIFKEINFVDINYKKTKYGHWQAMPSGLLGPVMLKKHSKQ